MVFYEPAYAKLNLALDVLQKRPDGYHDLKMIMQSVSLHDEVTVELDTGEDWQLCCRAPETKSDDAMQQYPQDRDNLAWRAAEQFFRAAGKQPDGLRITIEKRIPMQAGMAGGSSDAAAVLRALNQAYQRPFSVPELCDIGRQIGSDVPYCVVGGTVLAEGTGDRLAPLPVMAKVYFVIAKPAFSISTPRLFAAIDACQITRRPDIGAMIQALETEDMAMLGQNLCNVFQLLVAAEYPQVEEICQLLQSCGACGAQMTGTGSAIFGMFLEKSDALTALQKLQPLVQESFLAKPV